MRRSSAPAEASAEFFTGVANKARARKRFDYKPTVQDRAEREGQPEVLWRMKVSSTIVRGHPLSRRFEKTKVRSWRFCSIFERSNNSAAR
jgi:hypothetical protein